MVNNRPMVVSLSLLLGPPRPTRVFRLRSRLRNLRCLRCLFHLQCPTHDQILMAGLLSPRACRRSPRASGVSKANIYRYFESREAILLAVTLDQAEAEARGGHDAPGSARRVRRHQGGGRSVRNQNEHAAPRLRAVVIALIGARTQRRGRTDRSVQTVIQHPLQGTDPSGTQGLAGPLA